MTYTEFMLYALFVAPEVGMVIGTAVWKWMTSPLSSAPQGTLAGTVTALGTVLAVPILFGLLLAARELIGVSPALFASPVEALIIIIMYGGVVYWSLLTSMVLMPLGALVGWVFQRRYCPIITNAVNKPVKIWAIGVLLLQTISD